MAARRRRDLAKDLVEMVEGKRRENRPMRETERRRERKREEEWVKSGSDQTREGGKL